MASETGKVLVQWREHAGFRLDEASVDVGRLLGHRVSRETIRRYEVDYPESKMDPVLIVALAEVYGARIGALPDEMLKVIDARRDLLIRVLPCFTTRHPDQLELDLLCLSA